MNSPIGTPSHYTPAPPVPAVREKVVSGKVIGETSSLAGNVSSTGNILEGRVEPPVAFSKAKEFYKSVGRMQNVSDSFVLDIINRGWYYDDDEKYPKEVKILEQWEEDFDLTQIIESMIRNWILCGVHIISPSDWVPLQLESIVAKRRKPDGTTLEYLQSIGGVERKIPAQDFLELPYIDLDREPWGIGMFHSLMYQDWNDIDGKHARPTLEYYRQIIQDESKILHKLGSPRVIYKVPGANPEVVDNDIIPLVEGMTPGDRLVLNAEIDIVEEGIDGRTRFSDAVTHVIAEIDSGMQSSKNRLITEPSAMADAREAGEQDDDRVLGLMEKVRRFMNKHLIPSVTGLEAGLIEFKWGAKDTFDLVLPPAIEKAVQLNILSPLQAQEILKDNFSWKIPDVVEPEPMPQEPTQPATKPEPTQRAPPKELEAIMSKLESMV